MDDLLDLLERDPQFHSFLLDSQTIAVEDYLDLRPEREEQVKKFVKAGRLIVGPWYTLAGRVHRQRRIAGAESGRRPPLGASNGAG